LSITNTQQNEEEESRHPKKPRSIIMLVNKRNRELIAKWQKAKTELDTYKKLESELRDKIVDRVFSGRGEGTTEEELGAGFKIKCKQGYSYKVDEDVLKDVLKELPRGIKKKLIKTSVSLIQKGYANLDEDDQAIFDPCLTLTPSKPQLEITAPKKD